MTGRARLLFVGAGPRAIMLLERVLARADEHTVLDIDLVDPHPPGAGRIWRHAQSPLLKLNSMTRDVSVFTDDSCTIDGPVRPGPSLSEWLELWRAGGLPDVELDELSAAEARALDPEGFPTRRLHSHYLDWFFRRTAASAPAGVTIRLHADTVTSVRRLSGGRHAVALASGREIVTDAVAYCLGHTEREPDPASAALASAAARAGLVYVPPAFTADADLSALPEQGDVIVRGMGLAAVDLVVLLTQGRGGRFDRDRDGALRYLSSGREPRLHLGSRRGVPYRSKVTSTLQGDAPLREVLTAEAIADLQHAGRPLDFDRDAWPLIAGELLHGHYRELFTGHPDRVATTWDDFRPVLQAYAWDDPALREAIAAVVPDPLDRFDVAAFDRPFADAQFADAEEVQRRVRAHIVDDLQLRTTQERSPAQGVFIAALLSFMALSEIPKERWNARSRAHTLPVRWHTFFSYLASGPPPHRLEELLALADAGVVRFLGPDVDVSVGPRGFAASSPRVPGETVAAALVDAWLPGADAALSTDAALRELATVHGSELRVTDAEHDGSLGRVRVTDDGRVLSPDGPPHDLLFAIGPFTSQTEAGAFTRPAANSLSLRQTDVVAGAIAARLGLAVPVAP
ncbi:FAD/NAD(P)-binding protein [Microbacterium sp. M3]|uniref:FAD/NAD(P)-binding protein n=1 Tax=Microbacterium arthrosphaerae TaxID=792652 RepID=A0ABU4GZ65_9MICO|nr:MULTISPECIES: FAD/NAD(P)-binding protein [Microbacterium]MDW4571754.1 FAD/NAD(P)-binding protein [Microbacterium arthrosphaerae]MDW7605609.1 FAD/NAD(P)-binding protein [Microbacterium sp. M3]